MLLLFFLTVAASTYNAPFSLQTITLTFPSTHIEWFTAPSRLFYTSAGSPQVEYGRNGLQLSLCKRFDNPLLVSVGYIMYGKVEADLRGLDARGVISSLYLQSDDLDEIDIVELAGSSHNTFQTNFFVKGSVGNYERGEFHRVLSSPHANFHKYAMEWTPEEMIWLVDNNVVRRVSRDNPHGFPTSPQRVYLSIWAGGDPENSPGTVQWAGGTTTYDRVPYTMVVRNLLVINYRPDMLYPVTMRAMEA